MRTPCPACSKSHNTTSAAVNCRMRKAATLTAMKREPMRFAQVHHVGFTAFKDYLAHERRGDAVGGTA